MAGTLFDKIWAAHCATDLDDGVALLHVDRHLIHDLAAGPALADLAARGHMVRNPELTFATVDHAVSSAPGRHTDSSPLGGKLLRQMRQRTSEAGIRPSEN